MEEVARKNSVRRVSISDNMKTSPPRPRSTVGARHVQGLLLTLGFLCCYAMRVCLSVAIVAMVDHKKDEHFEWDEARQNMILSSFFWGYALTQVPGGMVAQRWGASRLFAVAMAFCALATLAIPEAARVGGFGFVCGCRVFSGLCQGVVPPIIHTLLAKWVPLQERGIFTSFVYSGGWIGNVIALQSAGQLSDSRFGWPACFYFWGLISLLWALLWFTLGKESPAEHPRIRADEKLYIESSLGVVETTETVSTPWGSILCSVPVWALLISQCAQAWGFWMLLTKLPTYLDSVLKYKIQENGVMSSLPYLCAWLLSFPVSFGSDWAIRTDKLSRWASRMLCNTFGLVIPAVALVGLTFVPVDQPLLAVGILVVAVASNIAIYCGHHTNHMDLSTNFAGPLMGFTNAAASICSILAPLAHGLFVPDSKNVSQWNTIFFLTAGVYVIGALVFLLFGSVNIQSWNDPSTIKKGRKFYDFPDIPAIPETLKDAKVDDKRINR